MKKLFFVLASLLAFLLLVTSSMAQETQRGQNIVLPPDQIVSADYFAAGNSVSLLGTVNGDAYLSGGNVFVDGVVNGDLLVAGGNINIRGRVLGNVRVAGGQVNIAGNIGRNLSMVGGSLRLESGSIIGGSLAAAGGSLDVFGPIGRGATFAVGQATLGSGVGGDVTSVVGKLILAPSARVAGSLNYTSSTPAEVQPGASVVGQIVQHQPPARPRADEARGVLTAAGLVATLLSLLSALILGLLLLRFFPGLTREKVGTLITRPWMSLLIGLIALIATPIIIFLLLITVIGIPLALITLAFYLITLYLAGIFTSLAIGTKLFELFGQKRTGGWALLLGLIVYGILTLIPIIGGIVTFIAVLVGLGAILLTWKDFYMRYSSKKLI